VEQHVSAAGGELWDVLTHLSDEQRMAVVLRYYGGYSASDIAAMLQMPAATVRSHLRRGLAALKKELAE
ncbi:MAG: sigma factor-like helix-turn-helix DNA-binding protein, partial [Acidimicrobiales bacterium]